MVKDRLLFNKTQNYQELLRCLEQQISYVGKSYFIHDVYEQAIASLYVQDDITKEKIVGFANYVDSNMNLPTQANKNRYHKIPTILAGAIYLDLYPDKVEELSNEELQTLAKYSINLPLIFYKNATMYYTKELLSAINQISSDFMYQSGYMYLAEKYLAAGKTPTEIAKYLLETDPKQLFEELIDYETKKIYTEEQEMSSNESRRI